MENKQQTWEMQETIGMGIINLLSCTGITKPDSMSEDDFRAIIKVWAGTNNFKLINGEKLYLNNEDAESFRNFLKAYDLGYI